jgi:hypothetical protein
MRSNIRAIDGSTIGILSRFIRFPSGKHNYCSPTLTDFMIIIDSAIGSLIKKELIPAVSYLRQNYPVSVSLFFPTTFLAQFFIYQDIDCTDLTATDFFFDSFKIYKYV